MRSIPTDIRKFIKPHAIKSTEKTTRADQRKRSGKNAVVKDNVKPLPNVISKVVPPSTTLESLWESEHTMLVNAEQEI